jgi:hypothetical protein
MADSLSGVVMTNGVPAPARITIVDVSDNSIVASVNNNASTGAWTVSLIPAGRYEVIVFRSGYRAAVEGPFDLDGIPSAQTFRYWRVHITANNGDGSYVSIQEIEFRSTYGGADECAVATGSTSIIVADSEANSDNAAWKAFDNILGTSNKWTPNGPPSVGVPRWIRYDFGAGSPKTIRQLAMVGPIGSQLSMAPKDFTVQGSNDASAWTTVNTFTNVTGWDSTTYRTFNVQ